MVRSVNINLEYYLPRIAILHEMLNLQFNEYKISEGSDRKQITEIIKYLCRECIQEFRFIEHFLSDDVFTIYGDAKQFIKRMSEFEAQIIEAEKLINEHEELREKLENLPPTDNQLSQQVTDLNAQLASATDTIASLQEKLQQSNFDRLESYNFNTAELHRAKTESNQYQKENESLKAKIAELEANEPSQSDTPADGEPLALVFDSTNANYAPDLVHALNLWLDLYHRNPKDSDSHTNKANIWLKNNTAYEYVKRGDTAMSRIREIATPLKDFGQQRAKEPKK